MSQKQFRLVVGRLEDGEDLILDLADPTHVAIQGMTRSGKSVLGYVVLGQLAGRLDCRIMGLDPSQILLGPLAAPDSDIVLGTADMARAATCLADVVAEMESRTAWLLAAGCDKLDSFSPELPLLVVILEEYPALLAAAESEDAEQARKPADRVAPRIARAVTRLAGEGAKCGIRLILLMQRADASIVTGAARSNIGAKFTFRQGEDGVKMLHNATPEQVAMAASFKPGMGLVELPGEPIRVFKADYLSYADYVHAVTGRKASEQS